MGYEQNKTRNILSQTRGFSFLYTRSMNRAPADLFPPALLAAGGFDRHAGGRPPRGTSWIARVCSCVVFDDDIFRIFVSPSLAGDAAVQLLRCGIFCLVFRRRCIYCVRPAPPPCGRRELVDVCGGGFRCVLVIARPPHG